MGRDLHADRTMRVSDCGRAGVVRAVQSAASPIAVDRLWNLRGQATHSPLAGDRPIRAAAMSTPPMVLAARLEHELKTISHNAASLVGVAAADRAYDAVQRAQALLEQIKEAIS